MMYTYEKGTRRIPSATRNQGNVLVRGLHSPHSYCPEPVQPLATVSYDLEVRGHTASERLLSTEY